MTPNRITVALEKYAKQIPGENISIFQNYLKEASDDCMDEFMWLPIKGKTKTLLFSIFLGGIAVDRFYVGDKGVGAAKLIFRLLSVTILSGIPIVGLLASLASSIWCFADIFITYKIAKQINYDNLTEFLKRHKEIATPLE